MFPHRQGCFSSLLPKSTFTFTMSKKYRSPMQQELLRRRQSRPLNSSSSTFHAAGSSASHLASTAAVPNELRRRQSISPAASDFIPQSATSYNSPMRRSKALIVGIGYQNHKHLCPLRGCRNDVLEMFQLIVGPIFGFDPRNVRVLCDELQQVESVRVEQPTRINILRDLKWLTQGIRPGDSVVFFFAGHGESVRDSSGDEVETGIDQVCATNVLLCRIHHFSNNVSG